MKSINHHLTDQLLMGYSAGSLPEAFNLVVATHVSLCDDCRARMHEFDAVGGVLMDEAGIEAVSDDCLAATMALIAAAPAEVKLAPAPSLSAVFPIPLQDYVGGDLDAVEWRRIGGGVSQAVLQTSDAATVRLLRIPAGVAVPDHGHRGMELTLVLQGAFRDETDRFGPGDIEVANEDMVHQPVAEAGLDCICLSATDAPLRFSGILPRMAQRVFGI
ncbi:MAG: ChrR family anti-sigma-E factor [Flavimaricola sp.]|nr:ChrR family anti-sigma-E factor [Flavimaricola sp.]